MDWKVKYSENIVSLNRLEKEAGLSAILLAISSILRKEEINYSVDVLGDFCQFFQRKDKSFMLEQLQIFAKNDWFMLEDINHAAILKKAEIESQSKLIEATCAQRFRSCG